MINSVIFNETVKGGRGNGGISAVMEKIYSAMVDINLFKLLLSNSISLK